MHACVKSLISRSTLREISLTHVKLCEITDFAENVTPVEHLFSRAFGARKVHALTAVRALYARTAASAKTF